MKAIPLLRLGLLLIVFSAILPGCGGSADNFDPDADENKPVIDPENSKDGIERTKHFDT